MEKATTTWSKNLDFDIVGSLCTPGGKPNELTWVSGKTGEIKRYQIINGNLTFVGPQGSFVN